jgi:hypothetical protein
MTQPNFVNDNSMETTAKSKHIKCVVLPGYLQAAHEAKLERV